MVSKVLFSSAKTEWSTPQDFYDLLNAKYQFTLDPCATKENAKCKKFFTIEDDGLKQAWANERVFINPPYSSTLTPKWVEKAYKESLNNNAKCCLLLPARTDTKWFHKFIYDGWYDFTKPFDELIIVPFRTNVIFVKGRLHFGGCEDPAPFPSMVVTFNF